jgi:glycosyltransferase involved in cell wall biosynthesis
VKKHTNVLIIQSVIKQYRVPFFELLHKSLLAEGVMLRVIYSQPNSVEGRKRDNVELCPPLGVKVPGWWFFGERILLQNVAEHLRWADLAIVEQANKHLVNYALMLASALRLKPFAFWGHGRNLQADFRSARERLKRNLVGACDWWFAYTQQTAHYVASCGVPAERITIVGNSTDTSGFRARIETLRRTEIAAFSEELGIPAGSKVGLYCGALYQQKCLPFLIESALKVRQYLPNFHLIIAGDGPDRTVVEAAVAEHRWVHSLGPIFDNRKALCFSAADVFLCPGLVGLAILDSFAAGLPLITTDVPIHGPEIEYLEDSWNGLITPHVTDAYSAGIVALLSDKCKLDRLKVGAISSAEKYSIERMVANFMGGVLAFGKLTCS